MSEFDKNRSRRIVRRLPSKDREKWSWPDPAQLWSMLKSYFGAGRAAPPEPLATPDALARFLDTRASFVAQTSLYGYLRTRAGMRYPELFEDDPFVEGINIAKWHIWLDSLSDLAVYAGGRMAEQAPREAERIGHLVFALVDGILASHGTPEEAGGEYAAHAERVRDRLARTDWLAVGRDEAAFTESPAALMHWSPIVDELKQLDEEVVRNSIRYRWQEVRRDLLKYLDVKAVLAALPDNP
jgi:hypothetical protein